MGAYKCILAAATALFPKLTPVVAFELRKSSAVNLNLREEMMILVEAFNQQIFLFGISGPFLSDR